MEMLCVYEERIPSLHRTFIYMLFSNKLVRSGLKLISLELWKFNLQELNLFLIPEEPFDGTIKMTFILLFWKFRKLHNATFHFTRFCYSKLMSKVLPALYLCVWSQVMTQNISVVSAHPACLNKSEFSWIFFVKYYTGPFIILSVITNIHKQKTKTHLNGIVHSHRKTGKVPLGTDYCNSE
jgi:hypothetical protein